MRYAIVDLEATCWEKGGGPDRMEIIEIGAVRLEGAAGPVVGEFGAFVKPTASPMLSDFCRQLTSIHQEDVDLAESFPAVFSRFLAWIGSEPIRICSWGAYDLNQFQRDCERHGIALPGVFDGHINLKRAFSCWKSVKPLGMKGALAMLGLPLAGTHHRGMDDARNIAAIARQLLPWLEQEAMEQEAVEQAEATCEQPAQSPGQADNPSNSAQVGDPPRKPHAQSSEASIIVPREA